MRGPRLAAHVLPPLRPAGRAVAAEALGSCGQGGCAVPGGRQGHQLAGLAPLAAGRGALPPPHRAGAGARSGLRGLALAGCAAPPARSPRTPPSITASSSSHAPGGGAPGCAPPRSTSCSFSSSPAF
eukprot:10255328-Alexandrium_andersonii.AAC.1